MKLTNLIVISLLAISLSGIIFLPESFSKNNNRRFSKEITDLLASAPGKAVNTMITPEKDLLQRLPPETLKAQIQAASKLLVSLSKCIENHTCIKKDRDPDERFFDPNIQEAHQILLRALRFLEASQSTDNERNIIFPPHFLHIDELLSCLKIHNEQIQNSTISLIISRPADANYNSHINTLIEKSDLIDLIKDDAKPLLFTLLEPWSRSSDKFRQKYLAQLSTSLHKDDIYTIVEVISKFDKFKLNLEELKQIIPSLCYVKTNKQIAHNWKTIGHLIANYSGKLGTKLNIDEICR